MKIKTISLAIAFLVLTLTPIVFAEENQIFFSVVLDYDSGIISQKDIKLIESIGEIDKKSDIGDYNLKIYSFSEKLLYKTNFDFDLEIFNIPPKEWFDDEGNQIYIPDEGEIETTIIEKTTKVLFVPYFSNAKTIEIFDENDTLLLSIDVSQYATKSNGNNSIYFIVTGLILLILAIIIYKNILKKAKKDSKKRNPSRKQRRSKPKSKKKK